MAANALAGASSTQRLSAVIAHDEAGVVVFL
jgi:hypothetical protein